MALLLEFQMGQPFLHTLPAGVFTRVNFFARQYSNFVREVTVTTPQLGKHKKLDFSSLYTRQIIILGVIFVPWHVSTVVYELRRCVFFTHFSLLSVVELKNAYFLQINLLAY